MIPERTDSRRLDIMGDEALPDATGENQGEATAVDFLVTAHMVHQPVCKASLYQLAGDISRQTDTNHMVADAFSIFRRAETKPRGKIEGQPHTDCDAFAMQQ